MQCTRSLLIVVIFAATTLGCRPSTSEHDNTTEDEQKVTQVGEREISAFSAGDIAGNLAVMTEDIVLMPANEPMRKGKEAMRAWLEGVHNKFTFDVRYIESNVEVFGNTAIERYVGAGRVTPKAGGAPIEDRFKGIHVYRRQPDGSWLIAQDIWNGDLPAEPASPAREKSEALGPPQEQ